MALIDFKYRKLSLTLLSGILAFMLINRANIRRNESLIILALNEQTVKMKTFNQELKDSNEKCIGRLEPAYLASVGRIEPKLCTQFRRETNVSQYIKGRSKDLPVCRGSEKHMGVRRK